MADVPAVGQIELPMEEGLSNGVEASAEFTSLGSVFAVLFRRRVLVMGVLGGFLLACLVYCLLAPREYVARARVAVRTPTSPLGLDNEGRSPASSETTAMVQSETVAGVLRSEGLAWRVILSQKLYAAPAFAGRFAPRFPQFRPDVPDPEAQSLLLERFEDRLTVDTLPRSLLIEIRFRTRDPRVSAAVVNELIAAYGREQAEQRRLATEEATGALQTQLHDLKARADEDDKRLAAFQKKHGILIATEMMPNGASGSTGHLPAIMEVDELGKELAAADSDRLLREAEYRAAAEGDPEVVLAFDPRLGMDGSDLSNSFRQLHARHSDLEQELAQLSIERGPNFPRVVEIREQLQDLDRQIDAKRAGLRGQFRSALAAAQERERLVGGRLQERTGEGQKASEAAAAYEGMRREADATRELYVRMQGKVEEAGLAAGAHGSDIWVVDAARVPALVDNKAAPNAKDAPATWEGENANSASAPAGTANVASAATLAPIAPGDLLEIGEFHTPEFRSVVHVSAAGTVKLPMIDEVRVEGMNELEAARAIDEVLVSRGILNHPQVSVLITAAVGQDVSVLGEVARPGVYPYGVHHRLFDMISAASGLSPAAGGVVNIYHRGDPTTPLAVPLDPNGGGAGPDGNPEIAPGDIVQVTRAGLVYVVGDVIRPGGFIVDPTQEFTVLKALSLAWGPSQNAAVSKALLIREQAEGRTVTSLNLKRMLRGKDPDEPIRAHDILFVPDSTAKNLFNRSIESAIQSAAGVSIYSGLVYSQRI